MQMIRQHHPGLDMKRALYTGPRDGAPQGVILTEFVKKR
jgi:hypothetical protein